jgi:hypothetical protein
MYTVYHNRRYERSNRCGCRWMRRRCDFSNYLDYNLLYPFQRCETLERSSRDNNSDQCRWDRDRHTWAICGAYSKRPPCVGGMVEIGIYSWERRIPLQVGGILIYIFIFFWMVVINRSLLFFLIITFFGW